MMSMLYLAFAPIFFVAFPKLIKRLVLAIKQNNRDQIKVEALFLGLMVAASLLVLMSLQRLDA